MLLYEKSGEKANRQKNQKGILTVKKSREKRKEEDYKRQKQVETARNSWGSMNSKTKLWITEKLGYRERPVRKVIHKFILK